MSKKHRTVPYIGHSDSGVIVDVYVQPLAKREQIVGIHDQKVKIHLKTPPIGGKANKTLLIFFARMMETPKSNISIIKGTHSRNKRILIKNISLANVCKVLENEILKALEIGKK